MPWQCKLVQQLELGWVAMALDYLHLGGVFLSWGSDSVNQRGVALRVCLAEIHQLQIHHFQLHSTKNFPNTSDPPNLDPPKWWI